jgi:hypothetical protein
VVGYEHTPPKISLTPLLKAFEVIAETVLGIRLGPRVQVTRFGLCHPVHQKVLVAGWEVFSAHTSSDEVWRVQHEMWLRSPSG